MIAHKYPGIQLELTSAEVIWLHYTKFFMELEADFDSCMHVFKEPTGVYYKLTGNYSPKILDEAKMKTINQIQKNKIEILKCDLDGRFYSSICVELRQRFPRVYIQLLPYNVFEQLSKRLHEKFGYKQAFLDYQELTQKRKRFCYLVCEKTHFNQVKEVFNLIVDEIENQAKSKDPAIQQQVPLQQFQDINLNEDALKKQQQQQQQEQLQKQQQLQQLYQQQQQLLMQEAKKLLRSNNKSKAVEFINIHNLQYGNEENDDEFDGLNENFEGIEIQKEDFPSLLENQQLELSVNSQLSSDSNQDQSQTSQMSNQQGSIQNSSSLSSSQNQQQQPSTQTTGKKDGMKRRANRRLKKKLQAEQQKAAAQEQLIKQQQEKQNNDQMTQQLDANALKQLDVQSQILLLDQQQQQQYQLLKKNKQLQSSPFYLAQGGIQHQHKMSIGSMVPVASGYSSDSSNQGASPQNLQGAHESQQKVLNKQGMIDEWDFEMLSFQQQEEEIDSYDQKIFNQDVISSTEGESVLQKQAKSKRETSSSSSTSSLSAQNKQIQNQISSDNRQGSIAGVVSDKAQRMMRNIQKSEPFHPDKQQIYQVGANASAISNINNNNNVNMMWVQSKNVMLNEVIEEQFTLDECLILQRIYSSYQTETCKVSYKENIYLLKIFKNLSANNLRTINIYAENLRRLAAPRITRSFGKVVIYKQQGKQQQAQTQQQQVQPIHQNNQRSSFELCILLEYKDMNLMEWMNSNQSISFDDRIYLFWQMLLSIQQLHSNHIVHANIKPSNILIASRNKLTIQDFYQLKQQQQLLSSSQSSSQQQQQQLQQNVYIPNQEQISSQADIYSLGLMGYYLFTNHLVDSEKAQTLNSQYMLFNILYQPKNSSVALIYCYLQKMIDILPANRPDIDQIINQVNNVLPSKYKEVSPSLSLSSSAFHSVSHIYGVSTQKQ